MSLSNQHHFFLNWYIIVTSCINYLEKAMAAHSSTLAREIPWTEEPGRLQSMGSRRVRHDWASSLSLFTFMHWRRKWQPTPVFSPGESQGGERSGLPSFGSHRVGHDWSDLAAAASITKNATITLFLPFTQFTEPHRAKDLHVMYRTLYEDNLIQWPPTFWAPGTDFKEDNFPTDWGGGYGLRMIQMHYIYMCTLFIIYWWHWPDDVLVQSPKVEDIPPFILAEFHLLRLIFCNWSYGARTNFILVWKLWSF